MDKDSEAQSSPAGQVNAWDTLRREWAIDGMPADKQRLARAAFVAGAAGAVSGSVLANMGDSEAQYIRANDEEVARQPVGQFKVVAYQQITPSVDDPEVFDAKLWALPLGHTVPEGCTPLYWWTGKDAPPAQAVDLGQLPDGWRLSKKATCYQLSHGNDIVGNLVGPDAEENAAFIARVLDSQAVPNG